VLIRHPLTACHSLFIRINVRRVARPLCWFSAANLQVRLDFRMAWCRM